MPGMRQTVAAALLLTGASAFDLAVVREDASSELPPCTSIFGLPGSELVVATAAAGSSAAFASNAIVWRPETASGKAVRTLLTNRAGTLRESFADSHTTVFQVGDHSVVEVAAEQEAAFEIASYTLGLRLQDVEPLEGACQLQRKSKRGGPLVANAARLKKSVVEEVVASVDGDAWYSVLEQISGEKPYVVGGKNVTTKTRYTLANEHYDVANYFEELCKGLGYQTSQPQFKVSGKTTQNVVCVKQGSSSDDVVVIGGHYDSTSQTPSTLAPGAVDDGSGAVGVLALATAMADFDFEKTVHFAFWGGEEQGIYGSKDYVSKNTNNIVAAMQMDMIAYSSKYFGVTLECDRTSACGELMNLAEANLNTYAPDLEVNKVTFSFGSDHVPFQQAGIPCFLAIELDDTDFPGYHDVSDTVSFVNKAQSVGIMRGLAGTLATLAGPL